jgi:SAM-dependent methyltransferase
LEAWLAAIENGLLCCHANKIYLGCSVVKLKLLPYHEYIGVDRKDPIRFYYWPLLGKFYRERVELALSECRGGERILEVGFGTGITFFNLHDMYQEIHGLDLTADIDEVGKAFQERGIKTFLNKGNICSIPYPDGKFDTVLLISILEHLLPAELRDAFKEIARVLKPSGQIVYGVPVERPLMVMAFRMMGVNIREHHFSTEVDIYEAAREQFTEVRMIPFTTILGKVYEIGHFSK